MSEESDADKILYMSFNQDSSCFAIGTEKGFGIFNSFPFLKTVERSKMIINFLQIWKVELE